MTEQRGVESYANQFTPAIPCHLIENDVIMSADQIYAAAYYEESNGNEAAAENAFDLLSSALYVNSYMQMMFIDVEES